MTNRLYGHTDDPTDPPFQSLYITKKYYPAPILSGPTVHPPAFRMCVTLLLVSLVHKRGIIYSVAGLVVQAKAQK